MRRAPAASLLLVALFAAACGGNAPSAGTGSSAAATASVPGASTAPSGPGQTASVLPASEAPSDSTAPSRTPAPTPAGTPTPGTSATSSPLESASPSASASAAASACQPEGSNPSFWPGIASTVSWDVYCAVLPKGWTVDSGKYRLANGGYLLIKYKGPGGASLALSEGSFCTDGSGCVPSGTENGDASFGALPATLVTTDAGGFAIVANRGQSPSWLLVTSGLDQATTTSLGAALALVH